MQLPLMITSRDRTLRAMQEVQLEGLKEIDRICRKHNIEYSLGGGTCLGQVRHGGFIPWDDDIDVDMTLDNYDKFLAVAPEELDSSRFFLYTRETEHNHYRAAARLGILGTGLSIPEWDVANRQINIFVDIFRWNYLPDDEKKRKIIASRLFFIHCMQNYKEFREYASKLDPNKKLLLRCLCSIIPVSAIKWYEDKLIYSTKGRTGWIIDDAIIHGDHGGYRSEGIDESKDVQFEGLTVRGKKDPENFLRTLYSDKYMEWLPPAKRISHHEWTVFDLGDYAEAFDLDDSYKDFMTIGHTPAKLKHMKAVSEMMIEKVSEICEKHGISYTICDITETTINPDIPDLKDLWMRPATIMMLRDEYNKFAEISEKELGKQFSYQTHENDPDYYYDYGRVRLNLTKIRDRRIRHEYERTLNTGFYIKIIPLDNYKDVEEAKKVLHQLRFWRRLLWIRWWTHDSSVFVKRKFRDKVKMILYRKYSLEDMYQMVDKTAQIFNDQECSLCYDSSHQLDGRTFTKEEVLAHNRMTVERSNIKAENIDELLASVTKRFGPCYLTYYDVPDHQLSILRYDEKNDRVLSNEEILESC